MGEKKIIHHYDEIFLHQFFNVLYTKLMIAIYRFSILGLHFIQEYIKYNFSLLNISLKSFCIAIDKRLTILLNSNSLACFTTGKLNIVWLLVFQDSDN